MTRMPRPRQPTAPRRALDPTERAQARNRAHPNSMGLGAPRPTASKPTEPGLSGAELAECRRADLRNAYRRRRGGERAPWVPACESLRCKAERVLERKRKEPSGLQPQMALCLEGGFQPPSLLEVNSKSSPLTTAGSPALARCSRRGRGACVLRTFGGLARLGLVGLSSEWGLRGLLLSRRRGRGASPRCFAASGGFYAGGW